MLSVYRQTCVGAAPSPSADAVATGGSPHLLHKVFRLSRQWVEHIPVHDLQHEALLHLGNLAEDLIKNCNTSLLAMAQLRALLCGNCRHLNAAQGQCAGQSLERCPLLQGASS